VKVEKILTTVLIVLLLLIVAGAAWIVVNIQNINAENKEQTVLQIEEKTTQMEETFLETQPVLLTEQTEETIAEITEETRPQFLDANGNVTILGMTFPQDAQEIDLTEVIARAEGEVEGTKTAYAYSLESPVMGGREEVPTTAMVAEEHPYPDKQADTVRLIMEVEAALEYLPNAEKVAMYGAWLDNELMLQFRENHRDDYKVVWSVQCGPLAVQTDARTFMPTKYFLSEGSFTDWHAYNLRYCEEMFCMDLGHMNITDLEFLYYMPQLKYLDIALTHTLDLTPLSSCKNLVFLVMYSIRHKLDYTPLQECTALEDLNIGWNECDISPILEMKQLKNLWIVGQPDATYARAKTALPDTTIGFYYGNPATGWRELPNYFAMRDELKMFYME